jgi:hypothetical protein
MLNAGCRVNESDAKLIKNEKGTLQVSEAIIDPVGVFSRETEPPVAGIAALPTLESTSARVVVSLCRSHLVFLPLHTID